MKNSGNPTLRYWMSTIVFAVVLFAALTNLNAIAGFVDKIVLILSPLGFGFALALIMNVPLRGMEKLLLKLDRKNKLGETWRRRISLIAVFTLTPVFLVGIILFFVPEFVTAISSLIASITDNQEEIIAFTSKFGLDAETIKKYIEEIAVWFKTNMSSILGITVSTAVSIVSSVISGIMCIILAIYILIDKKRIGRSSKRILHAFLPKPIASYLCRMGSLFVNAFSRFLSSQCLEAVILGSILFIGMTILRLPYALPIACMTVVFALIPYVGAFISLFLGAVMILLDDPSKAAIFAVMYLIVQQIEGNVIYPRVVGESVGLPAYLTLIAVSLGGSIMGIAGMMLFVPIASVAYTLIDEAVKYRVPDAFPEKDAGKADASPPEPQDSVSEEENA